MNELTEGDLSFALYSASSMLGLSDFQINSYFKNYAGLKAIAFLRGKKIFFNASTGFSCASREVLVGLGLSLLSKLFGKKIPLKAMPLVSVYKQFVSKKEVFSLNDALRRLHGRRKEAKWQGRIHNLKKILEKIVLDYCTEFNCITVPEISWSTTSSRKRLGWHDSAFNRIYVSRFLDSPKVPSFVVEYVVFHELLHAKHGVLFERGKSLRRVVHSTCFKQDEKKFASFNEAEAFLKNFI